MKKPLNMAMIILSASKTENGTNLELTDGIFYTNRYFITSDSANFLSFPGSMICFSRKNCVNFSRRKTLIKSYEIETFSPEGYFTKIMAVTKYRSHPSPKASISESEMFKRPNISTSTPELPRTSYSKVVTDKTPDKNEKTPEKTKVVTYKFEDVSTLPEINDRITFPAYFVRVGAKDIGMFFPPLAKIGISMVDFNFQEFTQKYVRLKPFEPLVIQSAMVVGRVENRLAIKLDEMSSVFQGFSKLDMETKPVTAIERRDISKFACECTKEDVKLSPLSPIPRDKDEELVKNLSFVATPKNVGANALKPRKLVEEMNTGEQKRLAEENESNVIALKKQKLDFGNRALNWRIFKKVH